MEEEKKRYKDKAKALVLAVRWTFESSPFLAVSVIIVSVFGGLITVVEPYLFKLILDSSLTADGLSGRTAVGLSVLGILVVYGIARFVQNIFWDVTNLIRRIHSIRMERYTIFRMMEQASKLDMIYFESPDYYNTLQRATQNIYRITDFFWQITFLVSEIVSVLVILIAIIPYDYRLLLLIIAGAVPSVIVALKWGDVQWSAFATSSPIVRHANYYRSLLLEQPEAMREIKSYGLHNLFIKKFTGLFTGFLKKQDVAAMKEFGWYIVIGIVEGGMSLVAAGIVVKSFLKGEMTVGDVAFLWALLFQFASHARWLVRMLGEMNAHAIFLSSIVDLLSFTPNITDPEKPRKFPDRIRTGIEFRNVSFQYPNSKRQILKNINLKIQPGNSIALVGENGSGKTTLVKLLCRLYDVTGGEILNDGINIKEFRLKDLYSRLGVIFQDFIKYDALIKENIGFGNIRQKATKRKVHGSAVMSGAWKFIRDLKEKYRTHVGKKLKNKGIDLSIGQWQKIAVARAFFRNPQILILDEPTAAVDAKAEYELFKKFERLTKNKITLLISHRFSTVRMADRIVVLHKGRILEEGSHEELVASGGKYASLFELQAKGYK